MSAFETGVYRNLLAEYGYPQSETDAKMKSCFETFFYGSEDERIYHEDGSDMAYVVDTGNIDVRTEGMSYAMMMCVQAGMKAEFDKLWLWTKTYMWHKPDADDVFSGYFAWS